MDDSYLIISPCRNEADFMVNTLESVVNQSVTPAKWIIVDDGSTDATPEILQRYADQYDFIQIVTRTNRGHRSVGPGVIEAFYAGLAEVDIDDYQFICKLDLDLELPSKYFELLMQRMNENPRLGTCSGKPYNRLGNRLVSEKRGDEMSVGMTKFYRMSCFKQIGGFVSEVMWDAIDCHRCRQLGWIACSWDDPQLRFVHLRMMGSSQDSIYQRQNAPWVWPVFYGNRSAVYVCHFGLPNASSALHHRWDSNVLGLSEKSSTGRAQIQ